MDIAWARLGKEGKRFVQKEGGKSSVAKTREIHFGLLGAWFSLTAWKFEGAWEPGKAEIQYDGKDCPACGRNHFWKCWELEKNKEELFAALLKHPDIRLRASIEIKPRRNASA